MRIIHCANFNSIRLKGCYLASMGYKLNNGLIRQNHQVIQYSNRDMEKAFKTLGLKSFLTTKKHNQNFYEFCLNIQPDIIIFGHADNISSKTLIKIKQTLKNVKLIEWNVDSINPILKSARKNIQNLKKHLGIIDYLFITTADKKLLNNLNNTKTKIYYLPNPIDTSIETSKNFTNNFPKYDIFFASSKNSLRQIGNDFIKSKNLIDEISPKIKSTKLLFPGLTSAPLNGTAYLEALSNSAMVINISAINSDYLYSSDRMAHAIGEGALVITDIHTGFNDIFSKKELVFYHDKEDLVNKINFFIAHPKLRQKIAKKGYEKYVKLFNEQEIAKYILSVATNTFNPKDYPYQTILSP